MGARLAHYIEERYNTLPFAERWAFPLLEKPFPEEDDESLRRKWGQLVKKLTSIRFLEVYSALKDQDGVTWANLSTQYMLQRVEQRFYLYLNRMKILVKVYFPSISNNDYLSPALSNACTGPIGSR